MPSSEPLILKPTDLLDQGHVSRETLKRLEIYADLLVRWQKRINLVGPGTLADPWRRHFLDSVQLAGMIGPDDGILTDLGSGAGFPGLVLAIVLDREVHLVESNAKKASFLNEVARETGASATVHPVRIEALTPWPTDVITARALAPLSRLLEFAARFSRPDGSGPPKCLFLKGASVGSELTEAEKQWNMRAQLVTSLSDPTGRVLQVSGFSNLRHDA